MNINIEKLKEAKITIPIAAIIACVVFIWNVSGKYTDFQESVATDDEISEIENGINDDISSINQELLDQDKRILVLEIMNGTLRMASESGSVMALTEKPIFEEEVVEADEDSQ